MTTRTFKTNLRCSACVESIKPLLDGSSAIARWKANVDSPDKLLEVEGDGATAEVVDGLLKKAGYRVLDEIQKSAPTSKVPALELASPPSYFPLFLIVAYIGGTVGLVELASGSFAWQRAMNHFMAGFFLVFSAFKMLDVRAFAMSYSSYDLIAIKYPGYGFAYPFIELSLGVAYLTGFQPMLTNIVTLVVMTVGAAGVAKSLFARRKIQCACLGTVFNLPMSTITLIEDGLMALMAGAMLFVA